MLIPVRATRLIGAVGVVVSTLAPSLGLCEEDPPVPRIAVLAGVGLRLPDMTSAYRRSLESYGFALAVALEARVAVGYRIRPWLEVGGSLTYLLQHQGDVAPFGTDFADTVTHHAFEVGPYGRFAWRGRELAAGFELTLGPQVPVVSYRGEPLVGAAFFVRPALFGSWVPGNHATTPVMIEMSIGYSAAFAGATLGPTVDGVSVLIGLTADVPARARR